MKKANKYFYNLDEFNAQSREKHIINRQQQTINYVEINRKIKRIPMEANLQLSIDEIERNFYPILTLAEIMQILSISRWSCPIKPFLYEENIGNYLREDLIDFLWSNYIEIAES